MGFLYACRWVGSGYIVYEVHLFNLKMVSYCISLHFTLLLFSIGTRMEDDRMSVCMDCLCILMKVYPATLLP